MFSWIYGKDTYCSTVMFVYVFLGQNISFSVTYNEIVYNYGGTNSFRTKRYLYFVQVLLWKKIIVSLQYMRQHKDLNWTVSRTNACFKQCILSVLVCCLFLAYFQLAGTQRHEGSIAPSCHHFTIRKSHYFKSLHLGLGELNSHWYRHFFHG
jgi:hypothetical protein